jgi:hypothetical protein
VQSFTGWTITTAIGSVTESAVCLVNLRGIGLSLHCSRKTHATKDARYGEVQEKISHVLSLDILRSYRRDNRWVSSVDSWPLVPRSLGQESTA